MKVDEKYFEQQMRTNSIDDTLLKDEKILLRTKPNRRSYILAAVIKMLPIALIWMAFDGAFLGLMFSGILEIPAKLIPVIAIFFVVHLAPVWIWIFNIIKASIEIKNIEYAFTDRRIIVRSGVIVDIKTVSYESIVAVKAKVGIVDRLCKVGDIYITANAQTVVIFDQSNPYDLASKLQGLAEDIKADMRYPNAMRPKSNPGYNTEYEGEGLDGVQMPNVNDSAANDIPSVEAPANPDEQ